MLSFGRGSPAPAANAANSALANAIPRNASMARKIAASGEGATDDVTHRRDGRRTGSRAPPGRADQARGRRRRERPEREPAHRAERALGREPRQERDAEAGRDHLPERLEAGRAKVLFLRAGTRADLERLVAQAVAVFQQQHFLALQVGGPEPLARGETMMFRHRDQEGLAE